MKSRWLTNLLLFTTVVILTLVARYEPGLDKPETLTVAPFGADAVTRIAIHRPLRDELVLERDDDGFWWIAREPRLPAEPFQVRALARLAEQKIERSYPVADMDLAALGLEPPRASVTLNRLRVDFGGLEALENLRYLRVGGRVALIPDLYLYLVEAGYTQFVRRQLLPRQARITALELPGLRLQRGDSGWETTPARELSGDDIQQFIDNWQSASAINVRPLDGTPEGERIRIELAGQTQAIELLVTARDNELVLARPALGIEYRMGNTAAQLLEPARPDAAP